MALPIGVPDFNADPFSGTAAARAGGKNAAHSLARRHADALLFPEQFWTGGFDSVMQHGANSMLPFASAFGAIQQRQPLLMDPLTADVLGGPDTPPQQMQLAPSSAPSSKLPDMWGLPPRLPSVPQQQTQPVLAPAAPPRAGRQPRSRASRTRAPKPKKPRGVWLAMARFAQSRHQAAAPEVEQPVADNAEPVASAPPAGDAAKSIFSGAANDNKLQSSDIVAAVDFKVSPAEGDVVQIDEQMMEMASVFMTETNIFDPASM